jgi:hypothetical protein
MASLDGAATDRTVAAPRAWPARQEIVLAAAAVVMQVVYVRFFLSRYPLLPHYNVPLLDLGKLGGYEPATGAAVTAAFAVLIAAHAVGWWAARGIGRQVVPWLLGASLVFQVTLVYVYPIVAADMFNYLIQGRLATLHGLNPLLARPVDAAGDPWLSYSAYRDIRLAYGPAWVTVAVQIARLAGDDLLAGLLAIKAIAVAANLLNSVLIAGIAGRLHSALVAPAVLAYAWCPLVLFETVANGHNDGVVATFVLAALWLVVRGGWPAVLAPASVMLAVLAKYTPLVLLPVVTIGVWRAIRPSRSPRAALAVLGLGLALAGLLVVLLFGPYWAGADTLDGVRRQASEATTSAVAILVKSRLMPAPDDQWLAGVRLLTGVGLAALIVLRRPRRPADTPGAVFDVALAQLLVATFWFQPWYVVPLVAFAAATVSIWRTRLALVFAASATASYIVYFYLWTTPWWGTLGDVQIQALAVVVTYGPPLVLLLLEARRRLSTAAPSPP